MVEQKGEFYEDQDKVNKNGEMTCQEKVGLSVKTPIGLLGIGLTTVCFMMTVLGLGSVLLVRKLMFALRVSRSHPIKESRGAVFQAAEPKRRQAGNRRLRDPGQIYHESGT